MTAMGWTRSGNVWVYIQAQPRLMHLRPALSQLLRTKFHSTTITTAKAEVETMPDLERDMQVDENVPSILDSNEETATDVKDRTAPETEAGDEKAVEQLQQQRNEKFGMSILAGEIQEYDPDGYNPLMFDVVAVHGIHGDRENTWTTEGTPNEPGSNWLKDRIYNVYSRSRILTFGYDAGAGIYSMARIREKALELLDDLVKLREGLNLDVFRPLVFIAHDLGGIIVKEIFFGCPHRCSSKRDMEDKVANLLFANKYRPSFGTTRSISELGRSIIEINESFIVSKMPLLASIVNVYSEEKEAALQIFDEYTATMDVPFEKCIGSSKSHEDMCKFAREDDLYGRIESSLSQESSPLRPDDAAVGFLQTVCSLAAPVWPFESLYGPLHRFSWISMHETYNKWLRSQGPSILHVYGTIGASSASEYIFQCLNVYRTEKKTDEIVLYFAFNRNDDRCNSVTAMLNTLLSQAINHNQDFYNSVKLLYEQTSFHSSWAQVDLLLLFRKILTDWDQGNILCVINGLNECDDSWVAFLEDICTFASYTERRFKIAITSTADSNLQAALVHWPHINLDEHPEDLTIAYRNLASDVDLEVLQLMQEQPKFCDFEKTITEKLLECGQDGHWRRLVLNHLRLSKSPSTKSATRRELNVLPPTTPKEILARILASVPSERRPWARKALSWILYAFYPLEIRQLGIALALDVDSLAHKIRDLDEFVYQDVIADLDEVFKGMFTVKHNEVHLGHPDVREFLLAVDGVQQHVWYDVKETAHKEIADACCFYLSLQKVQDSIAASYTNSPTDPLGSRTFIPRYGIRSYAIKYWPRHYALIPKRSRPTEHAVEFFLVKNAMGRWAEAYWWLSNPIRRADRAFVSLLPIFAGLGLMDLVTKWLDFEATTPDASQNRALALIEAARNAQVEVVRVLLSFGGYNQESLQSALIAATSCCDEAVLDELFRYAAESVGDFEWPPVLLCRAAQFGLENVIKRLLNLGASLDMAITVHDLRPLHLAARHGHTEVAKVLLEHMESLTSVTSMSKRVPLHFAAMYGHASIVKLLLDAKANCDVFDDDKTTPIDFACMNGNHQVVELLAKAGCDMGCDRQAKWSPLTVVADEGFIKSGRFLLDMKANTEVQGKGNWTPLRYAALNGHVEFCRLLLEKGANPNTLSGGDPILVRSAGQGNLEVVMLLVENNAVVDAATPDGWTALHKASFSGHVAVVTYLLDHGADIYRTNNMGQTSILLAARRGFTELVQFLIDRGADLHCPSTNNWTPLHLSYDFAEVTRVLMENGADANRVMRHYTPLYLAANENYVETVKMLLSFNPDLEIEYDGEDDQMGYTALTIATMKGHADVVRLLLEAGANVNHRSKYKYFPLEWAVSSNNENMVRILMEYDIELNLVDDDGDAALNCVGSATSVTIAKLLINRGADLEIRNIQGHTPVCEAVICNNLDIVKYLIAKKAELNITGGKNGGPLHIACYHSSLELVRILTTSGADENLVDPLVGTPLQSACRCQRSGYEKETQESIIRYLINEAKADVTTVGGLYGCVLNSACGRSTPEMVKLILEKGAKINVKDGMGRVAIHFAVARSMENFQLILDAGGDVEVRDKMGRTALHWAAIGGLVDVVARVISLSRGLVDQADNDGWTPLLWAARGCDTSQKTARSSGQREVINVLLGRGADPCIRGKGLGREWSPVQIARYHGIDDTILQLLMEKTKDKLVGEMGEDAWDETVHASAKAVEINEFCDSCLSTIYGIHYKCETCLDFSFCYKCYISRHILHPDHSFIPIGPEYRPELEKSEGDDEEEEEEEEESETDENETDEDDVEDDSDDGVV